MSEGASRVLTYREAVREALSLELENDPDVFVMGEDIGQYGGVFKVTDGLLARFGPLRILDTPISEAAFVGAAVGAAMTGKRPVVELMFMDFALVAADQLLNQAAKMQFLSGDQFRVPLTIRTQQGVGSGTAAQHSQSLEALFMHLPGFAVALPSSPADAKGLLASAIRADHPTIVIEHKALYGTKGEVPEGIYRTPFGQAALRRPGSDVTIASYSRTVHVALAAAETLAAEGIEAEVIDLRTLVPLDYDTVLDSVGRTGRLVVAHEGHRNAGAGAEIAARVSELAWHALRAPVRRVCGLDIPVPYAAPLEAAWLPSSEAIARGVRESLGSATSPQAA
ncbi:MAG TPA: alpha-ketoacid dehydrogenase subunit beta [Candidatus Eisenbacteria bacterium]|nr:alpha-ketoacid dehydrogenase subunit beta [Candidatus Eisenbacteria bacterium]